MCKRLASLLLCLLMLLSLALPAGATEAAGEEELVTVWIFHQKAFLAFAESCRLDSYSRNLQVSLRADIDLTGTDFSGIPTFSGIFEGNGHTIRGLSITGQGSDQGLFRYLTDTALVQNLHVSGNVQPAGTQSQVGGIAGNNAGQIRSCSFTGTVSGGEYVGGIVGKNAITGIVENCRMEGSVFGSHFVGGLAGENAGVLRSCVNFANINDTPLENTVALSDITLNSLTSSEAANTATDIGGIAGSSRGVIRDCKNHASVGYSHMGYNVGGIAGTQSGLILGCENLGAIQGRKEVGGIAGQMEPTASIEYAEDALQILKRQLNGMAGVVGETVSNVQSAGDTLVTQAANLQNQVLNAREAVDSLIPDKDDPHLPDLDTIQAAQNTISTSLSGMTESLKGMSATTYSTLGQLSNNLHSLQGQINAMRSTLGNVSETLGGSLRDVSDQDTEENLLGKITQCTNSGPVSGDRNVGGIAGAMAMENDLDPEEDWQILGENSLNFESELRCVILSCTNTATVTCKKQHCGGIAGWQPLGLVKDCINSGTLDAAAADYVGGITGESTGYIRSSAAKCQISGASYVGGIAGSASIAADCRSLTKLLGTGEKIGQILGQSQEPAREQEMPIANNFYFPIDRDLGAIDGISYDGKAQNLDQESFLALENLPELFRQVSIRFRYADGNVRSFEVPLGGRLSAAWIPPIPPKDNARASWAGLQEGDLQEIYFERTYEIQYTTKRSTLGSDAKRGELPVLLVLGTFPEHAALTVTQIQDPLPVEEGETLLEVWHFAVTDPEALTAARLSPPEGVEASGLRLLVQSLDGSWREETFGEDGGYLSIPLAAGDQGLALIQKKTVSWLLYLIPAVGLLALVALLVFRKRKKKK